MAISLQASPEQPPRDPKLAILLTDSFLDELYAKSYEYYVEANNFKKASGDPFSKGVVRSDLWNAIRRLRQAKYLKELHKDKPELAPGPEFIRDASNFLRDYYVQAHSGDDLAPLKDAEKLQEILLKVRSVGKIPWHYYVGLAAWELLFVVHLHGGLVPTKMQVKERAIAKRKKSEGGKYRAPRRWDRIFSDLKLGDLPSAQGGRRFTRPPT
jgi:hypothetical protein